VRRCACLLYAGKPAGELFAVPGAVWCLPRRANMRFVLKHALRGALRRSARLQRRQHGFSLLDLLAVALSCALLLLAISSNTDAAATGHIAILDIDVIA